jgi:hypothetical protein
MHTLMVSQPDQSIKGSLVGLMRLLSRRVLFTPHPNPALILLRATSRHRPLHHAHEWIALYVESCYYATALFPASDLYLF